MKSLRLFVMLALLTAFMVVTAAAADYYVYVDKGGQPVALDYAPAPGWTRIDGPFITIDAASRAWGIGSFLGRPMKIATPPRAEF